MHGQKFLSLNHFTSHCDRQYIPRKWNCDEMKFSPNEKKNYDRTLSILNGNIDEHIGTAECWETIAKYYFTIGKNDEVGLYFHQKYQENFPEECTPTLVATYYGADNEEHCEAIKVAAERNNTVAMQVYLYYQIESGEWNYEEANEYCKKIIDLGDTSVYRIFSYFLVKTGHEKKSIEALLVGVQNGHIDCITRLLRKKHNMECIAESIKTYLLRNPGKKMVIPKNCHHEGHESYNIYPLLAYELKRLVNDENFVLDQSFLNSKEVISYSGKLKNISRKDYCPICMEDNMICVPFGCFHHYVCGACYVEVMMHNRKCTSCRKVFD